MGSAGWWARSLLIALLVLATLGTSRPVLAEENVLPGWDYEPTREAGRWRRGAGYTASASYDFINDTLSDTWFITKSPLGWRWKGWLVLGAVAGTTTGLIFLADAEARQAALGSDGFQDFGEGIRYLGNGPGLAALVTGFGATGWLLDRPKERETARLLLEASAVGLIFTAAGKLVIGRSRPGEERGPYDFHPFSGEYSMPSGETTSAFLIAGVITSQYPQWWVQLTSYGLAAAVGAGRIGADAHWTSDVFIGAALGIAVSKAVVYFHRRRLEGRGPRKKSGEPLARHLFQVSPRAFRYTYVW
jgi:membrane-associated phospholipid phosphatase